MTRKNMIFLIVIWIGLIALPACTPASPEPMSGDGAVPIEPEVLPLVTQPAPSTMIEEALLTGILTYDENSCWRVSSEGTSFLIVWPQGFTATAMIGAPQVLEANGDVVGTSGMEISLGGGTREGDAALAFEQEHPDLPLDQCLGPYWVVGEVPK